MHAMGRTAVTRRRFGLGLAGLGSVAASGCPDGITGNDEHEREDPPWEWGGLYELDPGTYTDTYHERPDPDVRLAFVPADEGGEHGLFHAGETATRLFEDGEAETAIADGDAGRDGTARESRPRWRRPRPRSLSIKTTGAATHERVIGRSAHRPDRGGSVARASPGGTGRSVRRRADETQSL
jgi:zinc transport system substrate-binding protein